ncbi:MAG: hypothetical protein COB99_07445 [Sulfurimonas sp.]|nr:MAG: hypothetical protein COB99_07445 [Sulfurimonas sp.]
MNKVLVYVILYFSFSVSSLIFANQSSNDITVKQLQGFPEAPAGYSWKVFRGVAIPKPDAWFEFEDQGVYTTSLESVQKNGIFETGATIQVVRNIQVKHKAPASVVAIGVIKNYDEQKENKTLLLKHQEVGSFKTFTFRYRNAPNSAKPIIVHKFIMANDKDSFLNIITFEAPEEKWDKYWNNQGITIFKRILSVTYTEN